MSVDMRVQGCPKCNEHPQDCECRPSRRCYDCGGFAVTEYYTASWGAKYCERCTDTHIGKCGDCEEELFKPEAVLITRVPSSTRPEETEEWFFCDKYCVKEWRDSK